MSDTQWHDMMRDGFDAGVPVISGGEAGADDEPEEQPDLLGQQSAIAAAKARDDRGHLVARLPPEVTLDGADASQLDRIKAQREKITGLPEAPTEVELEQGETALADLPGLIQTIKQEITERRTKARAELVGRCPKEEPIDGADASQLDRIKAQREKITGLSEAPTEVELEQGETALTDLPGLIQTIKQEITERRTKARAELVGRCPKEEPIDGADASQLDRIKAQREKITGLSEAPTEVELEQGERALTDLPGLIQTIKQEITERRTKARAELVGRCPKEEPIDGADASQFDRIKAQREKITGLSEAPTEVDLEQGKTALTDLPGLIQTIKQEITERRTKARAELVGRCPKEEPIDGADASQFDRIKAQREKITGLSEAPTETELEQGETALTDLPGLIQTIKQEITERRTKARAELVGRCPKEEPIDGADASQLDRIKAQREKITGLSEAPTEVELEQGETALTDLPGLIQTIKQEITERRTKARAELVGRCPKEELIDGADTSQLDRIKAQREKVTGLSEAPTEVELEQGERALTDLPGLIQTIKQEITERRTKARAELVAHCVAEPDPANANADQLQRIGAERLKIKSLPPVPGDAELKDGETALVALKKVTDDVKKEIAARTEAVEALARAQQALRAAVEICAAADATTLKGKLTAPTALAAAKTVVELKKVKSDADDFVLIAQAAQGYGTERAKLTAGRAIFDTASGLAATAPTNPLTLALATAAGKANTGDFTAAKATLEAFKTNGAAAKITEVFDELKAFRASPSARGLSRINSLPATDKPPGFNKQTLDNELAAARDPVVKANPTGGDVATAKALIAAFKLKIDQFADYQAKMDELMRLRNSTEYQAMAAVTPTPVWTQTITARMNSAKTAAPITAAIALLDQALAQFPANVRPYLAAQNKVAPLLAAIGTDMGVAGTTFATNEYADKVTKEATGGKYAEATAAIGVLEPKLTAIIDYRAADAGFKKAAAPLDPSRIAELRAEADKAVTGNDFADALTKITAAMGAVGKWAAYQARRKQVDELIKSASTTQQAEIDPFVKRADALVLGNDPDGALAALNELRQVDAVSTLDAEVADALKRLAAAEAAKQQAVNLVGALSVPLDPLVKAADDGLRVDHKPADALGKLATAEAQLKLALEYARLYAARASALKALPPPPIVTPAEFTDAGVLAAGGDFAGAIAKLKTLATTLDGQCGGKAQMLETADGGHSREAHGVAVTATHAGCQDDRVKTGYRPPPPQSSAKYVPTPTATNFTSEEAWLAARQLAADEVRAKYGIDITAALNTIGGAAVTELRVIVEHGRPVGDCAFGLCPKYVAKSSGPQKHEAAADQTFEEVEHWTGLTRTRSVFKWKTPPGKWVLHQHFPEADDWDNVNQCYTAPVPEPSFK